MKTLFEAIKKKSISILLCIVVALGVFVFIPFGLIGCSSAVTKKVSTVQEFKNALSKLDSDDIIVLKNDLDFNYETIKKVDVRVDGNGHKIFNFTAQIDTSSTKDEYALFRREVKNLTLENFIYQSNGLMCGMFASRPIVSNKKGFSDTQYGDTLNNVHVKNGKMTFNVTYLNDLHVNYLCGGVLMSGWYDGANYPTGTINGASIKNIVDCSVENVEFEVNGAGTTDIYVGAIAGMTDAKISNSFVKDCTITTKSGSAAQDIRMGALVGLLNESGEITESYAKNNTVAAEALKSEDQAFGNLSTAFIRLGGVIGSMLESTKVNLCYSEENEIISKGYGGYYVGGFAGVSNATFRRSYSKTNVITCSDRKYNSKSRENRWVGGLVGLYKGDYIHSTFAYSNTISDISGAECFPMEIKMAGFIGICNGKSVNIGDCAAGENRMEFAQYGDEENTYDAFCITEISGEQFSKDSIYISIPTETSQQNINGCSTITEEDWFNVNDLKNKLKLTDTRWQFHVDDAPSLAL